jgi:redox-sensitive bicupin YhaK (pirin superfamily)
MSAGTGIVHSEFNPSEDKPCRCLQIWIIPSQTGTSPSYEQKKVPDRDGITLIGAPTANSDGVAINQDVNIHAVRLAPGAHAAHELAAGRQAYIQVAEGQMVVNDIVLSSGDGAAIEDESSITLTAPGDQAARALLFDIRIQA